MVAAAVAASVSSAHGGGRQIVFSSARVAGSGGDAVVHHGRLRSRRGVHVTRGDASGKGRLCYLRTSCLDLDAAR